MQLTLDNATVIGNELALSFADNLEIYLDLTLLRRACPCALCQGEPDALGRVVRPTLEYESYAFNMTRFQIVGGYAIQPVWGDGHSTGIYSFAYLQRLAELPPV